MIDRKHIHHVVNGYIDKQLAMTGASTRLFNSKVQ